MAKFNPITDLMPIDSSNESVDESSEQIKVIRTQLIQTRNSLSNVVNIIKTKNSLLDRDLDKIKSLNDRLQRTIPRIPIMRGKAGVLFGDTIEEEKKKSGLNIPMLPPRVPMEEEVVTYTRPLIKQAANIIGTVFNIGLIFGGVKSLISKPKVISPPGANTIIPTPGIGKPVQPQPVKIPNFFGKPFRKPVKKFSPTEKTGSLLNFSRENVSNIYDLSPAARMRMANTKNFPEISPRGRAIRNRARLRNYNKKIKDIEKKIPEYKIFDFMKSKNLQSPTALKSDLNKRYLRDNQTLVNKYKKGKLSEMDFLDESDALRKTYETSALQIDRYGSEIKKLFEESKKAGVGLPLVRDSIVKSYKKLIKRISKIDKNFKTPETIIRGGTFKYKKGSKDFEFKSGSFDPSGSQEQFIRNESIKNLEFEDLFSSLNIDTGITNTVIIITDPPTA